MFAPSLQPMALKGRLRGGPSRVVRSTRGHLPDRQKAPPRTGRLSWPPLLARGRPQRGRRVVCSDEAEASEDRQKELPKRVAKEALESAFPRRRACETAGFRDRVPRDADSRRRLGSGSRRLFEDGPFEGGGPLSRQFLFNGPLKAAVPLKAALSNDSSRELARKSMETVPRDCSSSTTKSRNVSSRRLKGPFEETASSRRLKRRARGPSRRRR
ncbi:hypothetical protein M885DRAFT_290221 [Pelagophyceae sp. CCMP2097]|nr:hypothetical protein M885DRAFT_290221 [Pelagophyceae sp. CCMP2097]